MKGMQGLLVAGVLGVLGVALNWVYLQGKTQDMATTSFLGICEGASIKANHTIGKEHLGPVTIPDEHAKDLGTYVYLYKDLSTVVGMTARRDYKAGDLLFRDDHVTPPGRLKLDANQKLIWIPVNSNSFVPGLVDPGDEIDFVIPVYEWQAAPLDGEEESQATPGARVASTETIGTFVVGSLGTRLSSSNVADGRRYSSSQERLVGIVISKDEEMEKALRLQGKILSGEYQNLSVVLVSKSRQ